MHIVVGLDGGGTGTSVISVERSGSMVQSFEFDSIDPINNKGWRNVLASIRSSIKFDLEYAVLGMSSFGEIDSISNSQRSVAINLFGLNTEVCNDSFIAHYGAFLGGPGIIVLSGTGSMSFGVGTHDLARCGGWGELIGDDGSAYWIGREFLRRVSAHIDGIKESTHLASSFFDLLSIDRGDIHNWINGSENRRSRIASLSSIVSRLAVDGNLEAKSILINAAHLLSEQAKAVERKLENGHALPWCFLGGVANDRIVSHELEKAMKRKPTRPLQIPVVGAALRAAHLAGWEIDSGFLKKLEESLR